MTRTVHIEEADGSVTPYIVPDGVTDEQAAARVKGKLLSTSGDIARAGGSGLATGVSQLALAPNKILTGLIGNVGKYTGNEKLTNVARERVKDIQKAEAAADTYGASYEPATTTGKYVKSAAAGAVQLPFSRNPVNFVRDMLLGATGGGLAQGAHEAGGGQATTAGASMLPFALLMAKQGLTPSFGSRKAHEAATALTPEQRATTVLNMERGREAGVNPMLWQAAPENTQLRTLGLGATRMPGAEALQARVTQQLPGHSQAAGQAAITRLMDPEMKAMSATPVAPGVAEFIKNQVAAVGPQRNLAPGSQSGGAVQAEAGNFGQTVQVKVPQQTLLNQLQTIQQQLRAAPTGPQSAALRQQQSQLVAVLGGSAPWPTVPTFKPGVSNVGEIESFRQEVGKPKEGFPSPGGGTEIDIKEAIRNAVDQALPVAGYGPALKRYGEVSQAVKNVAETAEQTAGKTIDPIAGGSRVEMAPELLYAAATTPLWSIMPPARRMAERANARNLAKLLQSTSIEELTKRAAQNPQRDALITALRMMLSPVQQGELDPEMLTR